MDEAREPVPRIRLVDVELAVTAKDSPSGVPFTSPQVAASHARRLIGAKASEHFLAFYLDARNRPLCRHMVSIGTLSTSLVHPREVFKVALLANAHAVVLAHNHPSGKIDASAEDRAVIQRTKEAGELLGVPLLDFLIVSSGSEFFSAREQGLC